MANAAESLFDSVLSNLNDVDDLNWPDDQTRDTLAVDPIDEPMDSSDDGIFTIDEEQTAGYASRCDLHKGFARSD